MKLKGISKGTTLLGALLALTGFEAQAGVMGPTNIEPGKMYVGAFGGAGASTTMNISQYGTAFFTEADGGPLAVNAFGRAKSNSIGFVGGQVGYKWSELLLNSQWQLSPAVELEGYHLGKTTFSGHEINNDTVRLTEHDFLVTYPLDTGVFLGNAVLNFNPSSFNTWHPYVGAGIGGAILSISKATATQVAPPQPGVNHYNSNPSDTVSTFAAQAKVGLSFDLIESTSLFVEYRGLYLADSNYIFGSTMYPTHVATSSWQVRFGSQYYNMGAVGIRYSL